MVKNLLHTVWRERAGEGGGWWAVGVFCKEGCGA